MKDTRLHVLCQFNEEQYNDLVYSCMSFELISKRTYAITTSTVRAGKISNLSPAVLI